MHKSQSKSIWSLWIINDWTLLLICLPRFEERPFYSDLDLLDIEDTWFISSSDSILCTLRNFGESIISSNVYVKSFSEVEVWSHHIKMIKIRAWVLRYEEIFLIRKDCLVLKRVLIKVCFYLMLINCILFVLCIESAASDRIIAC